MLLKLKAWGVTSVWFKSKQPTCTPSAETRNIRGQARHGGKRARLDGCTRLTFDGKQKEGVGEDEIVAAGVSQDGVRRARVLHASVHLGWRLIASEATGAMASQ